MKVLVFKSSRAEPLTDELVRLGFDVVSHHPDIVISHGGDGTLMRAEQTYPEVPKLPLRASAVCKLCSTLPNEVVLEKIKKDQYTVDEFSKLSVTSGEQTHIGLNDVVVHNKDPRHAIRYDVSVNDKDILKGVIGDGVVVATPLGSTGYYRSITDSYFEVGIGLAFNNSTEQSDHIILKENSVIKITIARGPAIVYVDNQKESIELDEGESVEIKKSNQTARIIRIVD
jgi:NAD kinase